MREAEGGPKTMGSAQDGTRLWRTLAAAGREAIAGGVDRRRLPATTYRKRDRTVSQQAGAGGQERRRDRKCRRWKNAFAAAREA